MNGTLSLPDKSNLEFDLIPTDRYKNDSLVINGDFNAQGVITITLNGELTPGTYTLINWTGNFNGTLENFNVIGVSGLPLRLALNGKNLQLVVEQTRAASGVNWTGSTNSNWDYLTKNFKTLSVPHQNTFFVMNDSVVFDDTAVLSEVQLNETLIANGVKINNVAKSYTFSGAGGIGGEGNFEKNGKGMLDLGAIQNTFTGKMIFKNAYLVWL